MIVIKIDSKTNKVLTIFEGQPSEKILQDENSFMVGSLPYLNASEELFFDPQNQNFYTKEKKAIPIPTEEQRRVLIEANVQKERALKWLADNDWKVNKRSLGEWEEDDPRWQAYLTDRAEMRRQIDEADAISEEIRKSIAEV